MSSYNAPIRDMQFVLRELAGLEAVSALPGCEDATPDVVDAIIEEANKFASGVLAPLNWTGDQEGARWDNGEVLLEIAEASPAQVDAAVKAADEVWISNSLMEVVPVTGIEDVTYQNHAMARQLQAAFLSAAQA